MADPEKSVKPLSKKPLCFVIGPIGKEGTVERKHSDLLLNAIIKQTLQHDEFGYTVKRADEDADPGMIGDRVVSDIINAELVVADLTDLNPNAFYELGIRHSTEKPTIHVAKSGTALPFDNVTHRTIFVDLTDWRSTEHARSHLAESVRTIRAPGYRVSNPITQANASFKMRQSDDPKDQVIAQFGERLENLESAVRGEKSDKERSQFSQLMESLRLVALPLKQARVDDEVIASALERAAVAYGFPLREIHVDSKENVISVSADRAQGKFLIDRDEIPKLRRR